MKKKVELVLNGLINVYLQESKPLSSTKLKETANLPFSASSIRSYLKELEECELVRKEHFSSGSFPSVKAMRSFWLENFQNAQIDVEEMRKKADELDIYIMIEMFENQVLVEVYNLNGKFIILEFEKDEVIFKYDDNLYSFFKSVKGMLLDELKKYLLHIGLEKEYRKIKSLYKKENINMKYVYKTNLDPQPFENFEFSRFPRGISFINRYMLIRNIQNMENMFVNFLILGDVYTNFFELTQQRRGYE